MERRVVITGMGAVSPLGLDVPALWQGVREARSGVGPITLCDTTGLESRIAGEVKGFDAQNYMDRKEVRRNDRFIHFAIAATQRREFDQRLRTEGFTDSKAYHQAKRSPEDLARLDADIRQYHIDLGAARVRAIIVAGEPLNRSSFATRSPCVRQRGRSCRS